MIVDISGTRLEWATVTHWCAIVMEEGGKLRPSSEHYGRLERLYRSLTIERIRQSRDIEGLHRAARMFDLGRHNPIPAHHGLATVFTRAEMGERLVELRNRRDALISGRAMFPRPKGPRLDPAFLTDDALKALARFDRPGVTHAVALIDLAWLQMRGNDANRARVTLDRVPAGKRSAYWYVARANGYAMLGNDQETQAAIDIAKRMAPNDPVVTSITKGIADAMGQGVRTGAADKLEPVAIPADLLSPGSIDSLDKSSGVVYSMVATGVSFEADFVQRQTDAFIAHAYDAASVDAATIAFAINGGMYGDDLRPVGYYVEGGERLGELDRGNGEGNFYMKPNGVFFGTGGQWRVLGSNTFFNTVGDRPQFGTQSGPMLVIDGKLHPEIQDNGPSKAIRNGVGVDSKGRAHFVISGGPVSFGQLARYFRDEVKVANALYLDGAVSSLWDPATGRQDKGRVGPIIVVTKREEAAAE